MTLKLRANPQISKAIKQKRMMRLIYHDKVRIIEPHDHGILNGSVQLLAWQGDGVSSRPIPNWILMKVDEMIDLTTLAETFPGGRPTGSGRRIKWDKLFIRVQAADEGGKITSARFGGCEPTRKPGEAEGATMN